MAEIDAREDKRFFKTDDNLSWSEYKESLAEYGIFYEERVINRPIRVIPECGQNAKILLGWEDDGQIGFYEGERVWSVSIEHINDAIETLIAVKHDYEKMSKWN